MDGEEAIILTTTPESTRAKLLSGRILAALSFLYIFSFLGFMLPFSIYCLWINHSVTVGAMILLFI